MSTVQVLNRLLAMHASSLPQYLLSAPPHVGHGDQEAWEILQQVAQDQQLIVDKLADFVEDQDAAPNMGEFPAEFTGFHDLSMDYIVNDAIQRQQRELVSIESLAREMPVGSHAASLAQEALGAAKGHLETLQECLNSVKS